VIHLFYYEQLPVKTIAGILGINENAVKTRLSRAREMLRKEMSRHE
jgi:RNA polymerase sigma-70 factor (ECF subfamily)